MYLQQCQEYLTIRQDIAPEKWAKFCDVVRSLVALYFHRAINLNPENEEGICAVLSNCDASSDPQLLCILADRIMSSRLTTPAVYKAFQVSLKVLTVVAILMTYIASYRIEAGIWNSM